MGQNVLIFHNCVTLHAVKWNWACGWRKAARFDPLPDSSSPAHADSEVFPVFLTCKINASMKMFDKINKNKHTAWTVIVPMMKVNF